MAGPSGLTPNLQLPYPLPGDTVDVPRDVQALATKLDGYLAMPIGALLMWPTASPPSGYLLCNGQVVPAGTYPQLATILGSSGGNITLPDFTGRFPAGPGKATAGIITAEQKDNGSVGNAGGKGAHTLTGPESGVQSHSHTASTGSGGAHDHAVQASAAFVFGTGGYAGTAKNSGTTVGNTQDAAAHTHTVTVNNATAKDATSVHENRPPFRAINFIIRAA